MDVKFWLLDVFSGDVVEEMRAVTTASLTNRFGGGACTITFALGQLTVRDGSGMDWDAITHYSDVLTPGLYSIAATTGTTVLGEWIIYRKDIDSAAQTITVSGQEWEILPSHRSVHTGFLWDPGNVGVILQTLLTQVFKRMISDPPAISIPLLSTSRTASCEVNVREGYYSDALAQIEDEVEWRIQVDAAGWNGEALTGVSRTVVAGAPVLSRSTDLRFEVGEYGTRQGNVLALRGGEDYTNFSNGIANIGAGDGAKRNVVDTPASYLPSGQWLEGRLIRIVNVQHPGVTSRQVLYSRGMGLIRRMQDMRDPWQFSVLADKIPSVPRVGDRAVLAVARIPVVPGGLVSTVRVGEVTVQVEAGRSHIFEVQAL